MSSPAAGDVLPALLADDVGLLLRLELIKFGEVVCDDGTTSGDDEDEHILR